MVGQRFGKQVVTREIDWQFVEILCDCGTKKKTYKKYLLDGQSKSCGCGRRADRKEPIKVGDRFGRLEVIQKLGTDGKHRRVLCLCDCGVQKTLKEASLRGLTTSSCGCLKKNIKIIDLPSTTPKPRSLVTRTNHGESAGGKRSAIYNAWMGMWNRTRRSRQYPTYLAVYVCAEWSSYEKFRDYVNENLGERPSNHSLDRIDNSKGYEPGNVRWTSQKQQARNRKSNTLLTIDGETRCIAEWSELTGVSSATICARRRRGLSDKEAVFTPVK